MCDQEASGIPNARQDDSYFIGMEFRAAGGVTVNWSDVPDHAVIFGDAAAAEAFRRASALQHFAVSFVPLSELPSAPTSPTPIPVLPPAVAPAPPAESEAEFQARLHQMIVDGTVIEEGRKALARWRANVAAHAAAEPEAARKAS